MSEVYVLGAYWGARLESAEKCAERLHVFLTGLRDCHESLSLWYQKADSPRKSLQRPLESIETPSLIKILKEGRNRENASGTVYEDLGFQVGFWNGQEGDGKASFSLRCGLYWQSTNPGVSVGNCVVLDLPKNLGTLASPQRMSQVLAVTASAWQPDWAGVMSESSMLAKNFDAEEPFVDWMVYVPRKVEEISEPAFISALPCHGSLIVVQPDPPSLDNVASQDLVSRVEAVVKRAR